MKRFCARSTTPGKYKLKSANTALIQIMFTDAAPKGTVELDHPRWTSASGDGNVGTLEVTGGAGIILRQPIVFGV